MKHFRVLAKKIANENNKKEHTKTGKEYAQNEGMWSMSPHHQQQPKSFCPDQCQLSGPVAFAFHW